MSKEDFEPKSTLLNPYIEIGKGLESIPNSHAYVNVSTFGERGLSNLMPPFTDKGPNVPKEFLEGKIYCVYGVVGRSIVLKTGRGAYLDRIEPPISRTLMGFLSDDFLKEALPKVHAALNKSG